MLKNEALFLPEAMIIIVITSIIVSLCTSIFTSYIRSQQIEEHVHERIRAYEADIYEGWQGCLICAIDSPDM